MPSHVKTATAILNEIGPAAIMSRSSTYHGNVRPSLNGGRLPFLPSSVHSTPSDVVISINCVVFMPKV